MEGKLYTIHIDTCNYVNNNYGVPICRLNCAPCDRVDPKNCVAMEEMPENTDGLKGLTAITYMTDELLNELKGGSDD